MAYHEGSTGALVFYADADEVPFEQDGERPEGAELRAQTDAGLLALWREVSVNPVVELRGSPDERLDRIVGELRVLAYMDFVARSPVNYAVDDSRRRS
jgi:hypothetical protein